MVGRIDGPRFCASRIFRVIPGKDIAGAIRIPASLTKNASSTIRFLLVAMAAIRVYLLAAKRSRICSGEDTLSMNARMVGNTNRSVLL